MENRISTDIFLPIRAFELARKKGFATALWRLPHQELIHCVLDFSQEIHAQSIDFSAEGFVFSPFNNDNGKKNFFIEAQWSCSSDTDLEERIYFSEGKQKDFEQELLQESHALVEAVKTKYVLENSSEKDYMQLVQEAIEYIKAGNCQKIVVSRRQKVVFETPPHLGTCFLALCKAYPQAHVSLVSIPNVGVWMGASPEILVSLDKNQVFRTMALAATQAYQGEPLSQATWTQKEIEEQALVSRYIINAFKQIRLREFEEDGPKTIRAGNLIHLRTDFWVDLKQIHFPNLLPTMLALLHPTSAVCGMPKNESLKFIHLNEGYNREFYSGFLGQVNFREETHLFVNLRCMQILGREAFLYAGGGITANSHPQKEWQETVFKMQTLLKVIGQAP
ncbi:MAG: hypothetical protein OHK0045_16820 [Raineya sp.]